MIGNLDAEQRFILEYLDFNNDSGHLTDMVDEWSLVADSDRDAATKALPNPGRFTSAHGTVVDAGRRSRKPWL